VSERTSDDQPPGEQAEVSYSSDRAKAFVDAVVAIALTLLILPLLDAITSLASENPERLPSALDWLGENELLLISFLISFAVIAMFWINHHRMFSGVRRVNIVLLWLNVAWLLTIVWLPVATTMTSVLDSEDPLVKTSYIGTMALACLLALVQQLYLRAHPALHDITRVALLRGMAANLAMATLFLLSLAVSIALPVLSYVPLFLLVLTGPLIELYSRMFGVRRAPTGAGGARRGGEV
jgi:uncharacterized membrane protein